MTERTYLSVSDVLTESVLRIDPLAPIQKAVDMMAENGVSSLVVERRDLADEFGLLAIEDIAREVVANDRALDRVSVYQVMIKPVLTLPPDMNIRYAVRLLTRYGLDRALVVDEHRQPVGMTTLRDIVYRLKSG